jgi:putative IMPACT (imprinted ancient) family translation regulator
MLNVLMQRKVGNVFAVVVRYFGGIKLGAGGLTRAYGQAVSRALDEAELCKVVPTQAVNIQVEFALEQRVRNILDQQDISILDAAYTDKVVLLCECPMDFVAQLREILQEQTAGRVTVNSAEAAQ